MCKVLPPGSVLLGIMTPHEHGQEPVTSVISYSHGTCPCRCEKNTYQKLLLLEKDVYPTK